MITKIKNVVLVKALILSAYPLWSAAPASDIHIRKVQEQDFVTIKELGLRALVQSYNLTDKERIEVLRKAYSATIDEDKNQLQSDKNILALVAVYNDTVIGYLSATMKPTTSQVYGRTLMIDPLFQKKGISRLLAKQSRMLLPSFTSAVCLTSKKNVQAQHFYEHLGGKRVENAPWSNLLYSTLNPTDFVGYAFDSHSVEKFTHIDA